MLQFVREYLRHPRFRRIQMIAPILLALLAIRCLDHRTDRFLQPRLDRAGLQWVVRQAPRLARTGFGEFDDRLKYRLEFASAGNYGPKDPSDLIFGVGVQMEFGAPVPPPPPPPPPKIVEVQVAPPPPPPPPPGPVDSDGDGVPDSIDQCPNTPKGDQVDSVGCTIKDEIKLQGVNFATGSAELIPTSDFVLSYAVSSLKKNPSLMIEVDGHTDSVGSAQKNLALSQARAESVMRYLKQHGVTNTMTAKGYGKDRPIADNRTSDGRLQNRRVSLKIVGLQ